MKVKRNFYIRQFYFSLSLFYIFILSTLIFRCSSCSNWNELYRYSLSFSLFLFPSSSSTLPLFLLFFSCGCVCDVPIELGTSTVEIVICFVFVSFTLSPLFRSLKVNVLGRRSSSPEQKENEKLCLFGNREEE